MRKFPIAAAVVALAIVGVLCAKAPLAYADTVLEVTPSQEDPRYDIQVKLNKAQKYATDDNPYIIKVAPGSYTISRTLRLYSNTTLWLEGVSLRLEPTAVSNMIRIGDTPTDDATGYYYRNIKVVGGDLDNTAHSNTCIKIAHAKNVILKNMTIHNARNGHLVEAAGVDGLTIYGCTLRDQIQGAGAAIPEAIQLDILNQKHMPGYRSEDLPLKNIKITKCTFDNVPRGIGAHTAVLNRYVKNVRIKDNVFTNLKSDAIRLMNFYDCRIERNVIDGAPRGVAVFMGHTKGMYLASSLAREGGVQTSTSSAYKAPPKNQKIVIKNNTITVCGSDRYQPGPSEGIFICGYSFSRALSKTSENDAVPKGNYYASGVTVYGNTIDTKGHGIRLDDARNSSIKNNKITYTGSRSSAGSYHGIYLLSGSKDNLISSNKIVNARSHGIFLAGKSTATSIKHNTISSPGQYGITTQSSWAKSIYKNTIKRAGSAGIVLTSIKKNMTVSGNKVWRSGKYAMLVDAKSKSYRVVVKGNKLTGGAKASRVVRVESGRVSVSGSRKVDAAKSAATARR